jgi:hypothetical protein
MIGYALKINTLGEMETVTLDDDIKLKEIQEFVGGYVTDIPMLTKYKDANDIIYEAASYIRDEGLLLSLPINPVLMNIVCENSGYKGPLHGNAVIVYGDDEFMKYHRYG